MGICTDPPLNFASHSCVRSVEPKQKEEKKLNHYMDFDPYTIGERKPAGAKGNARAAPRGAVARGARIERFAIRCPRQEGREAAAARGAPRRVAIVT